MIDLFSISEVRALLERHGFSFKKSLGQNFITNRWIPERFVSSSSITKNHGVLEIGPGIGSLTQSLCEAAGKVTCLEIDERLLALLQETLSGYENLVIRHGDALKADLGEIVSEDLDGLIPIACANLPYYITTPILERLFESHLFSLITVMVQKEVALRICAKPGTSDYGSFTVFAEYYSRPRILFEVSANNFLPRPKVDSAVVLFEMRDEKPFGITDEKLFFRIVRGSFQNRRKTLVNALSSTLKMKKEDIASVISACGHKLDVRGETLSAEAFAKISEEMLKKLVECEQ